MSVPASIEAERSILGAILLDNQAFIEATSLASDDFSLDAHRRIFSRMASMLEQNRHVDLITLIDELSTRKDLEPIGGISYVTSLIEGVPDRPSIVSYVEIVRDRAMQRRVLLLCETTMSRIAEQRDQAGPIMADMEDALARIAGTPRKGARSLKELMPEVLNQMAVERDRVTQYIGIPTGIADLDESLGGIRKGEFWIAGGMPGRGKTALGIQIAMNSVIEKIPTVDFSLEMTDLQVVRRILAAHTPAEAFGARDAATLGAERWKKVIEHGARLSSLPLYVDDSSSLTLRDLRARVKLYKKKFNIELAVVDYLRLLTAQGKDTRERVTNIALGLAQLAKDEQVSILALSQLSRPEDINHVPDMTDLKESGDLEAAAHVVLLIYRPFDKGEGRFTGEDSIIIGKAREGPPGSISVVYDQSRLMFLPRSFRREGH